MSFSVMAEGDLRIGKIDAFFWQQRAAVGDGNLYVAVGFYTDNDYFQFPVIDKDLITGYYIVVQVGIGDIDLFFGTDYFLPGGKGEDVSRSDHEAAVLDIAYPQLWALQVAKDGNIIGFGKIDIPDMLDDLRFIFMGAVGKIESEDIHAGLYEFQQLFIGVAGRSYRCDDLGLMESMLEAGLLVHIGVQIFRQIL